MQLHKNHEENNHHVVQNMQKFTILDDDLNRL